MGDGIELPTGGIDGYITEDKQIIFNNLPDGEYTLAYIMEDGTIVPCGSMVKDNNVYYTVTNTLTNCTSNNSATQAAQGGSYSATISANSGYELSSVKVTMEPAGDISSTAVSGGRITITNITGNIVITAVAVESVVTPSYTNLLPLSVDADGNDYRGTNNEDGYKLGYKMSGSTGNESATTGACCSGFIPLTYAEILRIANITLHSSAFVNNVVFYNANKARIMGYGGVAGGFTSGVTVKNGIYVVSPSAWGLSVLGDVAFFRFSCGGITDKTIVTVNEEIV